VRSYSCTIAGAGSFTAFTAVGLSPRTALLVMLVVPVGTLATFFLVLRPSRRHTHQHERSFSPVPYVSVSNDDDRDSDDDDSELSGLLTTRLTCSEKLCSVGSLLKYMIPLGLVYFFEYLINQVGYPVLLLELRIRIQADL
jgi:battenin